MGRRGGNQVSIDVRHPLEIILLWVLGKIYSSVSVREVVNGRTVRFTGVGGGQI